jgi:hypothetical protein
MSLVAHNPDPPLGSAAEVIGGYPFRGPVPEVPGGSIRVVQMKDLQAGGVVDWGGMVRTEIPGKRAPDLLRAGDVLVLVRGARNPAVFLGDVPVPAVSSLHFFLVRPRAASNLLAEFLAWQINQDPAQRYLEQNAEGTDQRSIRRAVLEALPVVVPPRSTQQSVLELARAAQRERQVLTALIDTRQREMQAVARRILEQPHP